MGKPVVVIWFYGNSGDLLPLCVESLITLQKPAAARSPLTHWTQSQPSWPRAWQGLGGGGVAKPSRPLSLRLCAGQ